MSLTKQSSVDVTEVQGALLLSQDNLWAAVNSKTPKTTCSSKMSRIMGFKWGNIFTENTDMDHSKVNLCEENS